MDFAKTVESVKKLGLAELVEEGGVKAAFEVAKAVVVSKGWAMELVVVAVGLRAGLAVESRGFAAMRKVVEVQLSGVHDGVVAVGGEAVDVGTLSGEGIGTVGFEGARGSRAGLSGGGVMEGVETGGGVSSVVDVSGDESVVMVGATSCGVEKIGKPVSESGSDVSFEGVVMPASGFAERKMVSVVVGDGGFSCYRLEDGLNRVYCAETVRSEAEMPRVVALRKRLREAGVHLPKSALADLALASCAGACVPAAFDRGREALRVLELIGDCALSMLDAKVCYAQGIEVGRAQARRAEWFSNARMSAAFARSGLVQYCLVPGGVDVGTSKIGANFVEAIAGVVSLHVAHSMGVVKYVQLLGLHRSL